MAYLSWMYVLLFYGILSVNCEQETELLEKNYSQQIDAVLNNINSAPNKVYQYRYKSLINAQQKGNIIELKLDFDYDCLLEYPEIPCSPNTVTCETYVRYNEENNTSEVLGEVRCKPKLDNVEETVVTTLPTSDIAEDQTPGKDEEVQLSQETVTAPSGESFIAVRRESAPCLGCAMDLNVNVDGISTLVDTAIQHIESEKEQKHVLMKILRAQQQVVAGIKYILLLEVAPTYCPKTVDVSKMAACSLDMDNLLVCEVTYLQQPWISKAKHIISNNCTRSQEFTAQDISNIDSIPRNDLDNEIDVNNKYTKFHPGVKDRIENTPNYDRIAESGHFDDTITPSRLSDLESQILVDDTAQLVAKPPITDQIVSSSPTFISEIAATEDNPHSAIVGSTEQGTSDADTPQKNYEETSTDEFVLPQDIEVQMNDGTEKISPDEEEMFTEIKTTESNLEEKIEEPEPAIPVVVEDTLKPVIESFDTQHLLIEKFVFEDDNNKEEFASSTTAQPEINSSEEKSNESSEGGSENSVKKIAQPESNSSEEKSIEDGLENSVKKLAQTESNSSEEKSNSVKKLEESNSSVSSEEDTDNIKVRQKRSIAQLEKISPDEKPLVRDLADFAAATLDNIDDDNHKRVVLQILGAKKMRANGIYYHLILRLGISHCPEDKQPGVTEDCREKLFENLTKICKVQVHVLDDLSSPKIAKSQCQNIKRDKYDRNRTNYSRYKRNLVGGHQSIDKNDPKIAEFLKSSLEHLDQSSTNANKYKVSEILSATSQVVAGVNYEIEAKIKESDCAKNNVQQSKECGFLEGSKEKTCKIKVWERVWLNERKYSISCNDEEGKTYEFTTDANVKRSKRNVPGGISEASVDDPKVKQYLEPTLLHLDSYSTHGNKYKIKEIISASKQIVSGQLWRIKAKLILSDCPKSDTKNSEQCGELSGAEEKICDFTVWDQPWIKNGRQTNITCENEPETHSFRAKRDVNYEFKTNQKRTKRTIKGGITEVSVDDPDVKQYLTPTLLHLDSDSTHENKYKVKEIISASKQVVSGQLWRIKAKLILSDCAKSESKHSEECGELSGAEEKICDFLVWDQPWIKNGRETNITCENEPKTHSFRSKRDVIYEKKYEYNERRSKRNVPGGISEASVDDPKVKQYLAPTLLHLDSYSTHGNKYKIKEIISASKQIVSGQLWRIKAKLILSDCPKTDSKNSEQCGELSGAEEKICHFTIWDQPWIKNGRQTNITCENEVETHSFRAKRDVNYETYHTNNKKTDYDSEHFLFKQFNLKHSKVYTSKRELKYRFRVFKQNLKFIRILNTYEEGTAKYGITRFADLTRKEFSAYYLGYRPELRNENDVGMTEAEIPDIELPETFDWRDKGVVSEVKNQGQCGSCWAFSVTGNVEGQYAIKHGNLLEFSEQELVDCDNVDEGCNGGLMDNAYKVIEQLGGLETEDDYPYDAENEKCHFNQSLAKVQLTGAVNISTDETDMAKWLVKNGPISIAINANAMQFYVGGVSHPWKFLCNPKSLDHGVLVVGYGVHTYPYFKKSLPYWIVKNSWGPSWGEQGYYRVYRGDGTCGVNQTPSSAIVE